jgi:hypothetical protein
MMRCKICSKIEGRYKLLIPKFASLIKHFNLLRCSVAKHVMAIGANYVNLNNAHKKNEKLYASTRCDTFVDLVEEVGNIEMEEQICEINLLLYDIC